MSRAVIVLKIPFPLLIPTMKTYLPLSVIPYTRYLLSAPFLTYGLINANFFNLVRDDIMPEYMFDVLLIPLEYSK
jgi:hypothetical protein